MWMVKQVRIAQRRVGRRIRELRRQRGWSQEFLAAEAGLNLNYLGGIERGERNPSLKNLAKIADALNVTIPDLVELLREPRVITPVLPSYAEGISASVPVQEIKIAEEEP